MKPIKSSAQEQYTAEKKRFLARQRPKRVLADKIKSREEKEMEENHDRRDYE